MWEYSEKVKEHFFNPRNVGKIDNADLEAEVGNMVCGDALKIYLKLDDKKERIVDAKFQTFGCGSAIASSSGLTEILKGKSIEEAKKITNQDIAEYVGGLPEEKMHCSVMGREALEAAINKYEGNDTGNTVIDDSPIICNCFGVTELRIKKAIEENQLTTVDQVTHYTKAGGGCGKCKPKIQNILDGIIKERTNSLKQSIYKRNKLIEETIEKNIRPALAMDGGNIELVDIDNFTVKVRLLGHCAHCFAATGTIKGFVENKLKEVIDSNIIVEEVQ